MAVKPGTWTTDPDGQQWIYSSSGWGEATGVSGDGFVEWSSIDESDRPDSGATDTITITVIGDKQLNRRKGPIGEGPDTSTLRWPSDAIDSKTDYVFFEFGAYQPPFARDVNQLRKDSAAKLKEAGFITDDSGQITNSLNSKTNMQGGGYLGDIIRDNATNAAGRGFYNASENLDVSGRTNIMLPIPQDLSNEIQAQWQGKQFTATGRAATAALAAANFSLAKEVVTNITGNAKALQTALTSSLLNTIPGVGGNISFNDVSGSTRGIVINPNAELLYDSPEMREVGMIFKLVPQNKKESGIIKDIVDTFRAAALPSWGSKKGRELLSGNKKFSNLTKKGEEQKKAGKQFDLGSEDNFITIPDLCKFTFMSGSEPHPYLIQFKPCAIQAVEVNYTPDGTFATYGDGAPAAVELRLNFMETKLIFADEVGIGF